jgi:hypothetical protein
MPEMKRKDHIILMADIVDSRKSDQNELMGLFKKLTDEVNLKHKKQLLSPITITLGDEFQCIVKDVSKAVALILELEEKIVLNQAGFKLRYVLYEGRIDTPINHDIAYGMLGEGLTKAREALEDTKLTTNRYGFYLHKQQAAAALMASLSIYQNIIDDWKLEKDHTLISKFLELKDYKLVAAALGKTRSQIWKRHKNLKIEPYFAIKQVTQYIADQV